MGASRLPEILADQVTNFSIIQELMTRFVPIGRLIIQSIESDFLLEYWAPILIAWRSIISVPDIRIILLCACYFCILQNCSWRFHIAGIRINSHLWGYCEGLEMRSFLWGWWANGHSQQFSIRYLVGSFCIPLVVIIIMEPFFAQTWEVKQADGCRGEELYSS